tara:strand:- start:257 stop:496 length:240 start_codon:yes stop_codon:yes gene_type:complete
MTHSKKIQELRYAKINLYSEYNALIAKHSKKNDTYMLDIMRRNNPLEEALLVSINAIEEVIEALEKESEELTNLFKGGK